MLYILCLVSIHTRYVKSPPGTLGAATGELMDIIISNSSDKPIYEQITTQIKDSIVSGELAAGDQLPSIRALACDPGISAITTKRAYADLEAAGFIATFLRHDSRPKSVHFSPRIGRTRSAPPRGVTWQAKVAALI